MGYKNTTFKFKGLLDKSMMEIEDLITEMQEVKAAHPTLELPDILRLFNIRSLIELTNQIRRSANK